MGDLSTASARGSKTSRLESTQQEINMDIANLSFTQIAISLFGGLLSVGLGLVAGLRIIPAFKLQRSRTIDSPRPERKKEQSKFEAVGRLLPTEIAGLDGNHIRYKDGSYGEAYIFEPSNSLYIDGNVTEQRIEELKTILKFEKPKNTVIQFRFLNSLDTGEVLREHLLSRDAESSDPVAGVLQATNLSLHEEAIRSGEVMRQTATVWLRVPVYRSDKEPTFDGIDGHPYPKQDAEVRRHNECNCCDSY
jgi:hypothetical protein